MADVRERLNSALADRYQLERELGQGGMATVYLAQDLRHHRPVAVKVLRPELAAELGSERFLREIEIAAQLTHPHILPVHDSGNADGFLYYVMPYVEGESLRDRLTREKQLPVDDALRICREVADALSYAHAHGVVHRDIKPENILLAAGHAVVADFGIARAVDQAGGAGLTGTGVALGTPAYMSPEQALGSTELDGRSDLYSLGCVLYEMLAGHPPFVGPSVESVTYQHISAPPPPITSIRPAVPAHVAATLERALAKTPADRFNPVALFAEALGPGAASGLGGAAPAPPGAARARRIPLRAFALLGITAAVVIAGAVAVGRWTRPDAAEGRRRADIAVLPFQNLSAEGPLSYFAGGLHDELITQLAKVAALSVRGRTSVMGYAGTTKSIGEIGEELSVGTIVEGSVQVVADRLRVNVQLIDAATDEHLWADHYDRTLDDYYAVQSEIAQQIVAAVGATLGETERTAITAAPTANPEAYRLYLQGLEYWRRPGRLSRPFAIAQDFFERALVLDSTFALAHAALSELHGQMWWFRYDPSPERLVRQREAAETALRLAPDLAQAHQAMGSAHYFGRRDWQAALREYRVALRGLPNDVELWAKIGYTNRRLGNWDEVLAVLDTVVALDPRNVDVLADLGANTFLALHRYPEAAQWYSRAVALAPDVATLDLYRAWTWVVGQGRLDSLKVALDRIPANAEFSISGGSDQWEAYLLHLQRKPDSLLAFLRRTRQTVFLGQDLYLPASLYAGWAHQLRGDAAAARAEFVSALSHLDSVVVALPEELRVHAARGLVLAALGRRADAEREAQWLREHGSYRDDAFGWTAANERALILAQIGDADAALEEIERLLAGPSLLSVHTLRLDPLWDPIREHPRFQALLVKYANPQPVH